MRLPCLGLLSAALATTACTANGDGADPLPPAPEGECVAEPGQRFIGQKATEETGRQLLEATGARSLRWVPPRTAVTMDFRPDRLTVSYDDDLVIEQVSCT